MELLKSINSVNSKEEYVELIECNCEELIDYFSITNYSELTNSKNEFHNIALKASLLNNLNFNSDKLASYVLLVLNTSIRLGDRLVFERYYDVLINNNIEKSLLIKTASLFMMNVRGFDDFRNRFEEILIGLEDVYHNESDSKKDSISALTSYYTIVATFFLEFASQAVLEIKELIFKEFELKKFSFLDEEIVRNICEVEITKVDNPIQEIQSLLDIYLGSSEKYLFNPSKFLTEKETEYSLNFEERKNLTEIIQINKSFYEPIKSDKIYYSLGRGVKILEEELQLFAYVYSFGAMHKEKLKTIIEATPDLNSKHTVIDWGCGQGLGTLMYLEKKDNCENCVLIEPSELALKRASLHIQNWNSNIITINKGFDDLLDADFEIAKKSSKHIHLMSNILDMDVFSLRKLIENIEDNFKGENYFLIGSPYIDISRTERIDTFVSHFEKYLSFDFLKKITEKKGQWIGTNWSRVIRVFKVDIA
jgi:hypothetical protein